MAWAQLEVLLQLVLLLQYLLWSQTLAHWSLAPEEAQQIEGQLLPRALELLQAAALAYWASVTPAAEAGGGAEGGGGGGGASLDPAQMVVNLRIADGPSFGAAAVTAKRPRLSQARDSRVASHLLTAFAAAGQGHGERRPLLLLPLLLPPLLPLLLLLLLVACWTARGPCQLHNRPSIHSSAAHNHSPLPARFTFNFFLSPSPFCACLPRPAPPCPALQ